jgi:hypothetical protein
MYVIERTDQGGGYLAKEGNDKAFTRDVAKVRIFERREDAERERCKGNEVVICLRDFLNAS